MKLNNQDAAESRTFLKDHWEFSDIEVETIVAECEKVIDLFSPYEIKFFLNKKIFYPALLFDDVHFILDCWNNQPTEVFSWERWKKILNALGRKSLLLNLYETGQFTTRQTSKNVIVEFKGIKHIFEYGT